jgi:hypothetical protein
VERPGYLIIKEAAVRYNTSRGKLHRLVKQGKVRTAKDPRDERATLLRTDDLDNVFEFPQKGVEEMSYNTRQPARIVATGLTLELVDQMDALRMSINGGRRLSQDSTEIIREEREKRSRHIMRVVFGEDFEDDDQDLED